MSLLFLSHSAGDADLAGFLEDQIRRVVPDCDVFRTSRVGQIVPGDEWFRVITEQLRAASSYLILVTPNSVSRPWMWFEAGAGWMTSRPVVPVTVAIAKDAVPEPLRFFQIYSLEVESEASAVFKKLGGTLLDSAMFVSAVGRLASVTREKADVDDGWEGFEFGRYFIAWEGPFEDYAEAADIPTPAGLIDALNARGMHQAYGIRNDLTSAFYKGYRQLWAVERKWKRRRAIIENHGQVLMTRPDGKPEGG